MHLSQPEIPLACSKRPDPFIPSLPVSGAACPTPAAHASPLSNSKSLTCSTLRQHTHCLHLFRALKVAPSGWSSTFPFTWRTPIHTSKPSYPFLRPLPLLRGREYFLFRAPCPCFISRCFNQYMGMSLCLAGLRQGRPAHLIKWALRPAQGWAEGRPSAAQMRCSALPPVLAPENNL